MSHFDLSLAELEQYRPHVAEPADFDDFWATTLAEARAIGGEVTVAPVETTLAHVESYDVTFPGFGGHPIRAWYSRPRGVNADLPVVVQYQGYNGGRGLPTEHTFWPSAGLAHLMMDTRGQGSTWGGGGDTPDPGGSDPSAPGFMTRGILDKKQYFYRRVFTDVARAIDAARGLPGVDASLTFAAGGSQGGGMTIAAAGLVPDLAGVMPDVPFLCHYRRALEVVDTDPYQEIRRYLATHRGHDDAAFETLAYFDGVNLAKRAASPALFSVGLMDDICPPSTVYAAFNHYAGGPKEIAVYAFNGHEGGGPFQGRRQLAFVRSIIG